MFRRVFFNSVISFQKQSPINCSKIVLKALRGNEDAIFAYTSSLVDFVEDYKNEESKLKIQIELNEIRNELKQANMSLLHAKGTLNVRGALEHIRSVYVSRKKTVDNLVMKKSVDAILVDIYKDPTFSIHLQKAIKMNKLKSEDVSRCFSGLYHESSKHVHGIIGEISIFTNRWAPCEVFSLVALFNYYHIHYVLYDSNDNQMLNSPYDLSAFPK